MTLLYLHEERILGWHCAVWWSLATANTKNYSVQVSQFMQHEAIYALHSNVVRITGSGLDAVANDADGNVVSWDASAVATKEAELLAAHKLEESYAQSVIAVSQKLISGCSQTPQRQHKHNSIIDRHCETSLSHIIIWMMQYFPTNHNRGVMTWVS